MSRATRASERIGLAEAAERLGVHYMTAYRYIRLGRLPAELHQGRWTVQVVDLDDLTRPPAARSPRRHRWSQARQRLTARMLAGDLEGSWAIIEQTLARGGQPTAIYLELLAPCLRAIGDSWAAGEATVGEEHCVTAVALRMVGRISPRFNRRGRRLPGTVILGAASGDHHVLPALMVSDVLRSAGLHVLDLGADVPARSFVEASEGLPAPLTFAISLSTDRASRAAAATVRSVRKAGPAPLVVAGGPAVADVAAARDLGADAWAPDAAAAAKLIVARHQTPTMRSTGSTR
jgi:methanogenic corrinoid protein MtbC1